MNDVVLHHVHHLPYIVCFACNEEDYPLYILIRNVEDGRDFLVDVLTIRGLVIFIFRDVLELQEDVFGNCFFFVILPESFCLFKGIHLRLYGPTLMAVGLLCPLSRGDLGFNRW